MGNNIYMGRGSSTPGIFQELRLNCLSEFEHPSRDGSLERSGRHSHFLFAEWSANI